MGDFPETTTRGVTEPGFEFTLPTEQLPGEACDQGPAAHGKFPTQPSIFVPAFFPGSLLSGLWTVAKEV